MRGGGGGEEEGGEEGGGGQVESRVGDGGETGERGVSGERATRREDVLGERTKNKLALGDTGMRDLEPQLQVVRRIVARVVDQVVVEEDVEVDHSRAVAERLLAPEGVFGCFEEGEEGERGECRLDL